MTYGWNTTKQITGHYRWTITKFVYGEGTTLIASGICSTRAKAVTRAKRTVMLFRRMLNQVR